MGRHKFCGHNNFDFKSGSLIVGKRFIFMGDNSRSQRVNVVKNCFEDVKIDRIDWPANALHINPTCMKCIMVRVHYVILFLQILHVTSVILPKLVFK